LSCESCLGQNCGNFLKTSEVKKLARGALQI